MPPDVEVKSDNADAKRGRLRYTIAIQATAVMLQTWFEDEEPSPEKAKEMVRAVMEALLTTRPQGPLTS